VEGRATQHHVVIIGGGFGGLAAAQALERAPLRVTLLDRRNFHLFQPLLYQVATGVLPPGNIAAPLRSILRRQKNVQVLLAEVEDVDAARRTLILADGELAYDTLIVAAGAGPSYFGHDEWRERAPYVKTVEDATDARRRILLAFEAAERVADPEEQQEWLTFVVVGAGPTGVELAGALAEVAHRVLKHDFRTIDPTQARIVLVEGTDRVLPAYPPSLSEKAAAELRRLKVTVMTGAMVENVEPTGVTCRVGDRTEKIAARTVLWSAGVQASPLARVLAGATGAATDRAGRLAVQPDLTLPAHPEIMVIGDMAHVEQDGKPLPGVAQVAMQEGAYAARLVKARLRGESSAPFHYRNLGNLAVIGRGSAVADFGRVRLSGLVAWWVWALVHILKLIDYESRLLVMVQWAWAYVTWKLAARLITGEPRLPFEEETARRERGSGGEPD
jgi:NADH dehydrogenase